MSDCVRGTPDPTDEELARWALATASSFDTQAEVSTGSDQVIWQQRAEHLRAVAGRLRASGDRTDDELATLLAKLTPHPCGYCAGSGWTEDSGWSALDGGPYRKGYWPEREEFDGLLPCICNPDQLFRDQITEPITVVDEWTLDQQQAAAERLRVSGDRQLLDAANVEDRTWALARELRSLGREADAEVLEEMYDDLAAAEAAVSADPTPTEPAGDDYKCPICKSSRKLYPGRTEVFMCNHPFHSTLLREKQ